MTETSAELPIQPELIADGQSLSKELNISWAGLVTLALWVNLGDLIRSAPGFLHPHVVISNNQFNYGEINTVVV